MAKRTGSVTKYVSVRNEGSILIVRCGGANESGHRSYRVAVFGEKAVPRSDYRVTYQIAKRGVLYCDSEYIVENKRKGVETVVCFLPKYFRGHFLKRTVEIVKGKK